MKIEFFDKETGNIIPACTEFKWGNILYAVDSNGVVVSINTEKWGTFTEVWVEEEPTIGWRIVED